MASIDKISGDEVIKECLLSVLSESLRNGKLAKRPSWLLRESSCPSQGLLEEGNGDGERGPRSRRSLVEEDERVDGACSGRFSIQHIIGEDLKCFRLSAPDHHLCLPDRHHLPNLSLHVHQGMCKCICVSRTAFDARMRR